MVESSFHFPLFSVCKKRKKYHFHWIKKEFQCIRTQNGGNSNNILVCADSESHFILNGSFLVNFHATMNKQRAVQYWVKSVLSMNIFFYWVSVQIKLLWVRKINFCCPTDQKYKKKNKIFLMATEFSAAVYFCPIFYLSCSHFESQTMQTSKPYTTFVRKSI